MAKNLSLEVFGKASIVADRGTMTEKRPEKTPRDEMYMLHPLSTVRFVWDAISAILICFIAAMLPYRIAFIEGWALAWTLTDFLMDLFFMCDIILNFRTGYVDSDGKEVIPSVVLFVNGSLRSRTREGMSVGASTSSLLTSLTSDSNEVIPSVDLLIDVSRSLRLLECSPMGACSSREAGTKSERVVRGSR